MWINTSSDDCPNNTKENMSLKTRCERIREIDEIQHALSHERENLYYNGLTVEQHNKLWDMVMADGKPHSL